MGGGGTHTHRMRIELEAALRRLGLRPHDRLLVAFSGGADSLGLLLALQALAPALPLQIDAAHVDHGLRVTSGDEAQAAVALAAQLGVSCQVLPVVCTGRGGVEAAARRARYRALATYAEGRPIVTAHTRDDQAETILLRLSRGTGRPGLAGIRASVRIEGGRIIRPLLGCSRTELRALVAARGLAPSDDPSNDDLRFARNRLRRVLPALETALPGAAASIARAAALLTEEEAYLTARACRAHRRIAFRGGVFASRLLALPRVLRGRVLRALAHERGGTLEQLETERVIELARRGSGELHLRRGLRARCTEDLLVFERIEEAADR